MTLILHGEELRSETLWQLVEERASYGDKPLLHIEDETLTYGDARRLASRLAGALVDHGVTTGDVVVSFAYNQVAQVLIWFACAKLGAIFAPLNVGLIQDDLTYSIEDCAPSVIFVDEALVDKYLAVRGRLNVAPIEVLLAGADSPRTTETESFLAFPSLLEGEEHTAQIPVLATTPLAIIYTGGSTGMPKGVLCSQSYFLGSALRYRDTIDATAVDVHYSGGHQMFHVGGLQLGIIGPMFCGMTSIMVRWFSASRYWDTARRYRATVIDPIGTIIAALIRQPVSGLDQQHNVRIAMAAATGQIPAAERKEFETRFGVSLLEVYAQTETGGVQMCTEKMGERRAGSCGQTWGWSTLAIADENDRLLPAGETGEILVRPDQMNTFMIEYWNKPEQTVKAWRNLWFHSGDLGYLDSEGWLYFVGRQAHWLRRRGENVSAFEVEQAVLQHPGVSECAVVGVPGELGDEDIKVYVVAKAGGAAPGPEDIVEWCGSRLAYFKVPRFVEFLDELPRSAAKNEIERHTLRARGIGDAWVRP